MPRNFVNEKLIKQRPGTSWDLGPNHVGVRLGHIRVTKKNHVLTRSKHKRVINMSKVLSIKQSLFLNRHWCYFFVSMKIIVPCVTTFLRIVASQFFFIFWVRSLNNAKYPPRTTSCLTVCGKG